MGRREGGVGRREGGVGSREGGRCGMVEMCEGRVGRKEEDGGKL